VSPIAFVVLTLIGVPLFVAVGLTTALALFLIDIPYTLLAQTGYGSLTPFPLLTIPMFVLAGRLMEVGGMANRMIAIATNLVGAYRNLMIIYGLVSETSIPRLFLAGLLPGLVVTLLLMITTYIIARRRNYGGSGERFSWSPFLKAAWDGKWSIGAPVLILGGIYGGVFTPTEAAGVAVFYSLFVGAFIYRELTIKKIYEALRFTALLTGILILLTPTLAFGQLTAFYDVPTAVQEGITSITSNPLLVLLLIGIFYIFIGTFMESLAQIVLFTAVFLPLVTSIGVDPVFFGIFTVITCEIGFLTPPLGANLTVAARISPDLALFLPNWLYGEAK